MPKFVSMKKSGKFEQQWLHPELERKYYENKSAQDTFREGVPVWASYRTDKEGKVRLEEAYDE